MKVLHTLVRCGFLAVAMLLLSNAAMAQNRMVRGKVTDAETGEALIGATVTVVGTTRGASTDIDGNFGVEIPTGSTQLRVAYTGYAEQVLDLTNSNVVNIALKPGALLEEVVVIGYGSVKKSDATGAVESITEKSFNRGVVTSPEQLMQGRMAGVQISNSNGEPGGGINIRIRGTSSVQSGNDPLFVIDGVPLAGGASTSGGFDAGFGTSAPRNPLNFINPADIASIDVLKDASATAIYGSRGANGVVLITTKKGAGKGTLGYDYSLGFSNISKKFDLLNRDEFIAGYTTFNGADAAKLLDKGANTNWQDEVFQTGISHTHNLSFGGGDKGGNYRFSLGYLNQDGIVLQSGIKKYTATFSASHKFLNDRLTIGTNITAANVLDRNAPISNNAGFEGDLMGAVLKSNPTWPINLKSSTGRDSFYQPSNTEPNPLAMINYTQDRAKNLRAMGNVNAEIKIFDGLTFKTVVGFDQSLSNRTAAYSRDLNVTGTYGKGRLFFADFTKSNALWENYFNYNKKFGNVDFGGLLGYSYQRFDFSSKVAEMTNFQTSNLDLMVNNAAAADQSKNGAVIRNSNGNADELQSYFGRVSLGISDKYLVTATLRADGSSRFGGNNQYGYFPSFAAKWRLGSESFMPASLSSLSLRVGYGVTGNQEFARNVYSYRQRYNDWDINNEGNITGGGLGTVAFAQPNIKWESTRQINVGVDYALVEGRVAGSLNFYKKNTADLLFIIQNAQPAPTEFRWDNLDADIQNSGVELSLNLALVKTANLSWNMGLNGAYNKNIVKKYAGLINTGTISGQGLTGAFAQRIAEGQPLFAFFVRDFGGYDDNGITIYNGGDIQQFIGSSLPKVTAGFTNDFSFGNFDASIVFNGQFGNKIYNNTANAYFTAGALANGRNVTKDVVGNGEDKLNAPDVSTRFLEDGSFVRLQNVRLGYRVPVSNKNISGLSIYVTGQNLAVFTNYSGQDPEVNIPKPIGSVPSNGIDYGAYPRARTIQVGASVTF